MPLTPGAQVDGRYDVIGPLADGGFATVWKVRHRVLGSMHALKVLRASTPVTRIRLLEEGRQQSRLAHPNIVRVTDVVEVDGEVALVMELVEGPTLADHLAEEGAPSLDEALELGTAILHGVQVAHDAGIIHRDLKPANILLSGRRGAWVPRITDFGLARPLEGGPGLTADRVGMGTPGYMAPEQYTDAARVDRRADIYALGAILYELLSGQPPFDRAPPHILFQRALEGRFETLDRRVPGLPPGLVEVIHASLSPDPCARPASCEELLALWSSARAAPRPDPASTVSLPALIPAIRPRAVFVVCAAEDCPVVGHKVEQMRALGLDVHFDEHALERDALGPVEREQLGAAREVWVFWSAAARRSPLVGEVVDLLGRSLAEAPRSPVLGRVLTVPLDRTAVPAELPSPKAGILAGDRPFQAAAMSAGTLLATVAVVALAAAGTARGIQEPLWWAFTLGLSTLGLTLLGSQALGRADRIFRAGMVFQAGRWLDRASARELIALADRMLTAIYGPKLLSIRSIGVSALIGTLPLVPLAVAWGVGLATTARAGDEESAAWEGISLSLHVSLPLGLANLFFDFLSLTITRRIVGRLLDGRGRVSLVAGLGLDAVVALVSALCPVLLAGLSRGWQTEVWSYASAVMIHLWAIVSGELRLSNLHRAFFPTEYTLVAFTMVTGCLPSLIHGLLLLIAGLNRLMDHLPTRALGATLRGAADRPAGPGEAALLLGLVVVGAHTASGWASAEPQEERWVTVSASACTSGCTLGSPEGEEGREQREGHEPLRVVQLASSFEVQDTELTQERWSEVWDRASQVVPDRYGLPRQPAFYRGEDLPVEGVSWCEAARFANLWSAVEERSLAYCAGDGCNSVPGSPRDLRHGLPGCERRERVYWKMEADGYRLLTAVEWEVAARGCRPIDGCIRTRFWTGDDVKGLLETDWIVRNSGPRPHPVARPPTRRGASHPLGLYDILGNVREWTWDNYRDVAPDGLEHHVNVSDRARVYRGASVLEDVPYARLAGWRGASPNDRLDLMGLRLARSVQDPDQP